MALNWINLQPLEIISYIYLFIDDLFVVDVTFIGHMGAVLAFIMNSDSGTSLRTVNYGV